MGSVKEEITRLETAKKDIETAIETCGVNVPDTELIDTYASYIRQIPSAVFSGLNVDPVGGADQFIQSIKQTNGLIEATVGGLVSTSNSGLVPKADGSAGVINSPSDDYVLTYKGGTIDWYKLPANAFKNDDNNTTYTLSGTLNGNAYNVTLTPSSGSATGAKVPAMGAASSSAAGTAGLVPAPAKNKHNSFLRGDGTWAVPDNTTYSVMTGATASAAGKSGLVPQPAKGDQGKFLSGAGTWTALPSLRVTDSESGNAVTDVEVSGHGITLKRGTTFSVKGHKHSSDDITALTSYIKATTVAAIASTDSLNSALGKLELKADTAYNLVKGAYDGDGTIENLAEILKVLEGISDTDTIQAIIGKYLPLEGGTMTGNILLGGGNAIIGSGNSIPSKFKDSAVINPEVHSVWIAAVGDNSNGGAGGEASGILLDGNTIKMWSPLDNAPQIIDSDNGTAYNLLHSGNSSVSKSGQTLTVKINGVEQSITNSTYSTLPNPYNISFKNTSNNTVTYNGSSALDLTGGIYYAVNASKASTLDCFTRRATANCTWGTLTASNGYTPIYWGDSASGGGIGFSDKGGQTFMQIDGDYYAQEGAYKVWHAGNLTKVSQLSNDAGYLTSLPSHVHTYIQSKDNYTFTASTLPNSFDWGVSAGFVADNAGYGSYGSVLTVRTYTGGGGTLQLYAPYSKTYGGTRLKARFGDYDKSNGNSWTDLKEIAWTSDIPTSLKSPGTLTLSAGTFSAKTYDGSANVTVNIPTHTSHLTNNSSFMTETDVNNKISGFITRNVNTNTNTNPFIVSRVGGTVEALKIGVDDGTAHFVHEQDETASDFLFKGKWNDTESGGGKNAGEKTIRFGLSSSDHNIYVGSSAVLHAGNYTSYTVTKDGTGASGTWGINITGNAATATSASVLLTSNTAQAADACYSGDPGLRFWRFNGTGNSIGGGDGWIMSWSWNPGSVGGQIYLDDNPSKIMAIRGFDNATKTFNSWSTFLHSSNYTDYTVKKDGTGASGTWGINISGSADKLDGYHAGLTNGSVAIFVPFPSYTSLKNSGYVDANYGTGSYGHPDEEFLKGICKWAIATYPNQGDLTLMGVVSPNSSGTCILHLYSSSGKDSTTKLPRYCRGQYLNLSGYLYHFGTVDYAWSYNRFAFASELKNPTNYYWANVKISDTSSTATSPTFANATTTGLLTVSTGGSHCGIKAGSTYINSINSDLILQNNGAIRFGTDSWDYNCWAGLKYVHSSKTISLGLADGTHFTANTPQSGGTMQFPGIGTFRLNGTVHINPPSGSYVEGIRMHPSSAGWTALVFCGDDNTADSGTSAKTWGLFTNGGNLYINKNNSSISTGYELCNVSGNWGIGTTSPAYKLEVAGSICGTVLYANRDASTTAGGVSLYYNVDPMLYGIAFRGTGTYGTHGYVTAANDWATYLTMNDQTNRGWIFRRGNTNVASIAGNGNVSIGQYLEFSNSAHIATNRSTDYHYGYTFNLGDSSNSIGMYSGAGGESGGVVVSPDTCLIYNSSDTGYNLQVRDKDLGSDLTADATLTFAVLQSNYCAWARGGFQKSGSSDSYVLLGGGGHKAESSLSVNYANSAGSATTCAYPAGFTSRGTNDWSGVAGTLATDWSVNGADIMFKYEGSQLNVITDGRFYQGIDIYGASKRVLDEYDIDHTTWGSAKTHAGYSRTITVGGNADTYYPVVINTPYSKNLPNIVTIWKNLGSTTASYPGNHDNGTASCLYRYEVRINVWDGNGGYCKCLNAWYGYAPLVAHTELTYSSVGHLCIWLRGGGTTYEISSTWDAGVTVYYSRTDLYGSPYSCIVEPRTSIGNGGKYSSTYLGYGDIAGNVTGSSYSSTISSYLSGHHSSPNDSHPGHGAKVFYSWNIGSVGNDTAGYSTGITIGSNPNDTGYGFQIVQNLWDDRTYTRRYNGGWQNWKTLAWTSDIPTVTDYYWANIKVSASSSTSTQPTFNTCYTSNWFRSTGNTGWYNETHTGGIYMADSTWVRIYNDKKFYVSNSSYDAIHSAGGVYVAGCVHAYANYLKSTNAGIYLQIGPQNGSHAHYVTDAGISHWFNKTVQVDGNIEPYGNNKHSAGSTSYRFSNVYSYAGDFVGPVTITYNSYPGLTIHNNTTSGEASMYIKNNTGGWALGVNPWGVGAGVFAIGQYSGTGSSSWRFKIDNNGYCYTNSYLSLGGGHEKNASSPTYVWGSNSSDTFLRSYQTSSLSVNYATSAGNADKLDDLHASSFYIQGRGEVNAQVDLQTIPKDASGGWMVTNSGWTGMVAVLAQGHNASNRAIGFLCKGGQSSRINLLTQVDNTWGDRGVIAYTSDIPTKTSQLTNDSGFITGYSDTWRPVQCNGTSIGSNTLNLKAGSNVSLSNSSGAITITATDTNYYPVRSYTSGLQISTYSGSTDCSLYVPHATTSQDGVINTVDQSFKGNKTFTKINSIDPGYLLIYAGKVYKKDGSTSASSQYGMSGFSVSVTKLRAGAYKVTLTNNTGRSCYIHPILSPVFADKGGGSCYEHGFAYFSSGDTYMFPTLVSNGSTKTFTIICGYMHTQGNWNTGDFTKSNDSGGFTCEIFATWSY